MDGVISCAADAVVPTVERTGWREHWKVYLSNTRVEIADGMLEGLTIADLANKVYAEREGDRLRVRASKLEDDELGAPMQTLKRGFKWGEHEPILDWWSGYADISLQIPSERGESSWFGIDALPRTYKLRDALNELTEYMFKSDRRRC